MKILYLAVYRDGSGWAEHAQRNILALDRVGVEVIPRCIKLNNVKGEVHPRILELEGKSDKGCSIVIQHLLPHLLEYSGGFEKNIAIYCTETTHFHGVGWSDFLNMMDEAWVPCSDILKAAEKSGVNTPHHIIPIPHDTPIYKKDYEEFNIPILKDHFIFYFIGDFTTKRKNLQALLRAFHTEFDPGEPTSLIIKSNIYNKSTEEIDQKLREYCDEVKRGLKLYPKLSDYKSEIFINQRLSNEDVYKLHKTCDCFVMPSYGESWCIPAFDSVGFGNQVIYNNVGGMRELSEENIGEPISNVLEPIFDMQEGTFPELFLSDEEWRNIDINELRGAMRQVYKLGKEEKEKNKEDGLNFIERYSFEKIGKQMKKLLEK